MSKKRKNNGVYIDRSELLSKSNKLPNVLPGLYVATCNGRFNSDESRFIYKLVHEKNVYKTVSSSSVINDEVKNYQVVLIAMVMPNGICVLMCGLFKSVDHNINLNDINTANRVMEIQFYNHIHTNNVGGKMKKGAVKLKAGEEIGKLLTSDQHSFALITPVGGQLLGLNDSIVNNIDLINNDPFNTGYLAIIYPDTEIPNEKYHTYDLLVEKWNEKKAIKNLCYQFKSGECKRGNNCKFSHEIS